MSNVALKVNAESLVQNLRLAFSNRNTYVAELMQNARRAGASKIEFSYVEADGRLIVTDDGAGIRDMQNLLSIADSGWDQSIKDEETPYGMGFLSALYQARHVFVESGQYFMHFDVDEVFSFQDIEVQGPVVAVAGTRIILDGIEAKAESMEAEIWGKARGFPIDVVFNGEWLERPDAIDSGRQFVETQIGKVHVPALDADTPCRQPTNVSIYLQGNEIESRMAEITRYSPDGKDRAVVHLDPTKFFGKLPDRETLVDQQQAEEAVRATIRRLGREHLTQLKATMDEKEFVTTAYDALHAWGCLDLLNDMDYLPPEVLGVASYYPMEHTDWESPYADSKVVFHRSQIEAGKEVIFGTDGDERCAGEGFEVGMYLYSLKARVLCRALHSGHWLHEHVKQIDADDIDLKLPGEIKETVYDGRYIMNQKAMVVDKAVLSGPVGDVEVEEGFLFGAGESTEKVLILPPKAGGEVVRQLDSFRGEWSDAFEEEDAEGERDLFDRFLMSVKSGNEVALLKSILIENRLYGYESLQGKSFRIDIGSSFSDCNIELIDPKQG